MKRGAFDYLTKPVDDEYLIEVLDNAIEHGAMNLKIEALGETLSPEELKNREAFDHLPTQDQNMIRLFHHAERIARGDMSVFIWESGAQERNTWPGRFTRQAPGRKSPSLQWTELHTGRRTSPLSSSAETATGAGKQQEKQGFIEAASGGTLFIDNIESLSLPVQVRLEEGYSELGVLSG